jgi:hypothetical protein
VLRSQPFNSSPIHQRGVIKLYSVLKSSEVVIRCVVDYKQVLRVQGARHVSAFHDVDSYSFKSSVKYHKKCLKKS